VALQILLNPQRQDEMDRWLVTDGAFGTRTQKAIDFFRDKAMRQSGPPGVADPGLWRFLLDREKLQVIDAVDVTDPSALEGAVPPLSKWTDPIVLGGLSNGVDQLVREVRARVRGESTLMMLRLHGHGSPGLVAVSHGSRRVSPGIDPLLAQSVITLGLMPVFTPLLRQLGPLFCDFGFIELHSCRVGEGPQGESFVRRFTDVIGAPVRAGASRQPIAEVFTLTGKTFSAFPGGVGLQDWGFSRSEAVRPNELPPNRFF